MRPNRALAFSALIVLALAACSAAPKKPTAATTLPQGGTLRAEATDTPVFAEVGADVGVPNLPLDPQKTYDTVGWEILRCCLARTLVANPGLPYSRGGTELHPDLATALPTKSADGLTWTFHLKKGIHYGPPFQNIEVTAADFIRALHRMSTTKNDFYGNLYYSVIQGYGGYQEGKSETISGLEAPDRYTLVVRITRPTGDFAYRFTLFATSPLPPNPTDPSARFGAANGHEGYGTFLVSTGPYMIEGSDRLDFTKPPASQKPVSGFVPEKSLRLVRNPSWNRSTDSLRPANVDEIVITAQADEAVAIRNIVAGTTDVLMPGGPAPTAALATAKKLREQGSKLVHVERVDIHRFTSLNPAQPPFDDLAVRRAANYVADRAAMLDARGGPDTGTIAGHISLDSLQNGILVDYNPYRTPGEHGSVDLAKQEMKKSRYDTDHDGVCDTVACRSGTLITFDRPEMLAAARVLQRNLASIGIRPRFKPMEQIFEDLFAPDSHWAVAVGSSWGKDYLNAGNFFLPLFSSNVIGSSNWLLLGASKEQLRGWGYKGTVPNVDDRMNQCLAQTGGAEIQCWASLDQYMMNEVVPIIPWTIDTRSFMTASRILGYAFDQFAVSPALDQMAIKPSS